MARILGIESSCDETAAAVVEDRTRVLSSVIASQVELHREYGGVVPELAARRHVEAIGFVISSALEQAEVGWDDLDAVAVTHGPGLIGCLLVGVSTAKAIAWQRDLPLLAINHLEGHVRSAFIEHPQIEYPVVALVVSGGHTSLYLCPREGEYRSLARTRDDAAGEAFDKVGKLLGLSYPGGPIIDSLARDGDEKAYHFPRPKMKDGSLDFSFSGLKTAVRIRAQKEGLACEGTEEREPGPRVRDMVASFQRAVVDVLIGRTIEICRREGVRSALITGGVACNGRLRRGFRERGKQEGLSIYFPSPELTTDNAAMIAAAGFLHLDRGQYAPLSLGANASLKL